MAAGSPRVADSMARPVLVPAGNKTEEPPLLRRKPLTKATRVEEEVSLKKNKKKKKKKKTAGVSVEESKQSSQRPLLLRSNLSPNVSCSSDCSADSFRSRTASTPRVGGVAGRPKKHLVANLVGGGDLSEITRDKRRRCPWVTPKTEPRYTAFHDEEWGVAVHDDKKLFELLVLSGALSELTWPEILIKRNLLREVFMEFDPVAVSKLNEKKITAQRSTASSLVSEVKLRSIIENARQILKIVNEFGSFDYYCWNFVNHKPITGGFRYPRQVPVRTSKADVISKDLVKRGFRCVGPTVVYSFMQVAGITNDHLIDCYRFEECCRQESTPAKDGSNVKVDHMLTNKVVKEFCSLTTAKVRVEKNQNIDLELANVMDGLNVL